MNTIKSISELIEWLEKAKEEHGDIEVLHTENDEYWGSIEGRLTPGYSLKVGTGRPEGPKRGPDIKCVLIGPY